MNALEMSQFIGKVGYLDVGKNSVMQIAVKVFNVRESFGRIDFQVTPRDGNGNQWVESSRVTSLGDAK